MQGVLDPQGPVSAAERLILLNSISAKCVFHDDSRAMRCQIRPVILKLTFCSSASGR